MTHSLLPLFEEAVDDRTIPEALAALRLVQLTIRRPSASTVEDAPSPHASLWAPTAEPEEGRRV